MLGSGLDRLVGLHLNRCEQVLREGFAISGVRDRADIADRLAYVCEAQGRDEEAKEFRRQSERRAAPMEVSQTVSSAGKELGQKTQVNFGGAGVAPQRAAAAGETRHAADHGACATTVYFWHRRQSTPNCGDCDRAPAAGGRRCRAAARNRAG